MNRVGLVIQGPLDSFGMHGQSATYTEAEFGAGYLVQYDCRENIRRLVAEYGSLFDAIVVSTWDDQMRPGDAWEGVTLVAAPDPGAAKEIGKFYTYKANNKLRQFVSMRNGIRELKKSGVNYAVKIRTDQYVNLKLLLDSVRAEEETGHDAGRIYVPFINPKTFLMSDHFFAGGLEAMERFCEAVLAYNMFGFIACVHRDIVLKHAFVCYRNAINVPDWAYFPWWPPHGACRQTKRIFEYMFANVYRALDPAVLRSMEWRGSAFDERYLASRIREQKNRSKTYSIPALIAIDWRRYALFRAQECGRKPTVAGAVAALIGRCGWNLWCGLKSAVRHARAVFATPPRLS